MIIETSTTYISENGRTVRAVRCRYDGRWDCNVWVKSRNDWTKATTIFDLTKATPADGVCCGLPLPAGVGKYGCPNCNGDNAK